MLVEWCESIGRRGNVSNSSCSLHQQGATTTGLVWLISFGDLLTLLVCFFLVLTPWAGTRQPSLLIQQQVNSVVAPNGAPGTALASRSVGLSASRDRAFVTREYVLTKSLVSDEHRKALREVLESVKRDSEESHVERARVLFAVCGEVNRTRVLQIVGTELSETLGDRLELEIEIESQCQTIQSRHSQVEDLVGSIALVQG